MRIAVKSNEASTIRQVRELLRPFEYTRVDRIVDVVFDTAADVEQSNETSEVAAAGPPVDGAVGTESPTRTTSEELAVMRRRIVGALEEKLGVPLVQRRRAFFESSDGVVRVCVSISKRYEREYQPYWYAFHPAWNDFIGAAKNGYFVLGCMDRNEAFALPKPTLDTFLPKLNQTVREDGTAYWHVVITTLERGELALYSSKTGDKIPLRPFSIALG